MPLVDLPEVERLVDSLLADAGVPEEHRVIQSELLIDAEMRGLASHGLLRLPRILERIANGVASPAERGHHDWQAAAFLRVDGRMGLGPVVALSALQAGSSAAKAQGAVVVSIANSNHIGSLGFYAERIARAGQCLLAFSTSEALVHPWGGRTALIGTNPIAIGVPTETEPFVMDTATSIVSMGKIHDHADRGEAIPLGWAVDAEGRPTTNAAAARGGSIAPFGGAKGYALGLAFELLVSGLAGSAIGTDVKGTLDSTQVCNKADLFILIDRPMPALGAYLDLIRQSAPAEGVEAVRIPGERGRASREHCRKHGLSVDDVLWGRLNGLRKTASAKVH